MKNSFAAFALLAVSVASALPMNGTNPQEDFAFLSKRAPAQVFSSCTESNAIALTFDDGPYIYHQQVANTLTQNGAKGTFFVNGNNFDCIYDESVANQLKASFGAGHQIASHTWSHPHLTQLSTADQTSQLTRLDTALMKILGIKAAFLRPPFGEYNDGVLNVVGNNGQNVVLWDFDSGDSTGSTAQQSKNAYDNILAGKPNNLLALNHETQQSTVTDVLPYVLNKYKNSGYKFVTVAECLGMQPYLSQGNAQARDASWTCN